MIPARKANAKIFFTGMFRDGQDGSKIITLPREESKHLSGGEYLVTIEGPINEKRTSYNRVVISL